MQHCSRRRNEPKAASPFTRRSAGAGRQCSPCRLRISLLALLDGLRWPCQLVQNGVQRRKGLHGHADRPGVAPRPAPRRQGRHVLAQILQLAKVGELGHDGRRDHPSALARELDGPRILVHLELGTTLALLAPRLEGGTVQIHAVREDRGPRPEGTCCGAPCDAEDRREGDAARAPLLHRLRQVRDHGHVAREARGSEDGACRAKRVGIVAVEVRRHGAPSLVANELADG
mmetsp:Transcript_132974/g.344055  ORF Transcript_132974/g.344055 Transcript_132974/m.344055 type:complete len:230 (-) Transcript_132974:252-941(-)